jgi:hypothetical protein
MRSTQNTLLLDYMEQVCLVPVLRPCCASISSLEVSLHKAHGSPGLGAVDLQVHARFSSTWTLSPCSSQSMGLSGSSTWCC